MTQGITDIVLDEPVADLEFREAPEGVDPGLWNLWENEEMTRQDKFLWTLKRGQQGMNVGYDNGRKTINKYIHGTHRARYYLIGAESGAGKTTIGDFMFVLKLWEAARKKNRKLHILYLSFEIGKIDKMYRWCSYFIWHKHKLRLPADYLQGQIEGRIPSGRHVELILEAYSTIKGILDRKEIVIIEDVKHPTAIFEGAVEEVFSKYGEVHRTTSKGKDGKERSYITGYTEGGEEVFVEVVIDHLALTGTEMGLDTKGIMDKMSRYIIVLRNMFNCSAAILQQFSTDMMNAYRGNYGKKEAGAIRPTRLDFGDSKATFRDADVTLGYVKPQSEMINFMGYDLRDPLREGGMGNYFVAEYLMKNRYGPSGRLLPLMVDYVTGCCVDLPLDPTDATAMQPYYQEAQLIEQVCQDYSPINP